MPTTYYLIVEDQMHPFMAITFYNDKGIFVKNDALYLCANVIKAFFTNISRYCHYVGHQPTLNLNPSIYEMYFTDTFTLQGYHLVICINQRTYHKHIGTHWHRETFRDLVQSM